MLEAALLALRHGLSDPLTIIVGLVAGAGARSLPRSLGAGAAAAMLLLGVGVATGRIHPQHISWPLLPVSFVPVLAWAALGHVGRRWHDEGERRGLRLARGLTIGAVAGGIVGLAGGLAYVNCAAGVGGEREASWMTMLASLLGAAVGAIAGMLHATARPSDGLSGRRSIPAATSIDPRPGPEADR